MQNPNITIKCPMCGSLDSLANIPTPPNCNAFMLIGADTNGNFNLPPSGILVSAKGCTNCGSIFLGSPHVIGAATENGSLKL
ncbi:hypothetical protein [Paraclostridium bifermentans]|uniref:hypothetical protein n=1 Tax=Paraclostridium bifermentans TaxID=1490 RepID=UPI0022E4BFC9|nr:hypothetical protein [Paraclostridium bifermentans]